MDISDKKFLFYQDNQQPGLNMNWSKSEINHIRVSLDRCDPKKLSNELGTARESVEKKIKEVRAKERLSRLSEYVKERAG